MHPSPYCAPPPEGHVISQGTEQILPVSHPPTLPHFLSAYGFVYVCPLSGPTSCFRAPAYSKDRGETLR